MERRRYMGGSKIYDAEVEWIGGSSFQFTINGTPTIGMITHKTKIVNLGSTSGFNEVIVIGYWNSNYVLTCRYDYYRDNNTTNVMECDTTSSNRYIGTCGNTYTRTKRVYNTTNAPYNKNTLRLRPGSTDYLYSYYIQIYDMSDNLVFDFIPVRVGSEGCLYDKVNGTLYHATSGTPVFGSDVVGGGKLVPFYCNIVTLQEERRVA